MRAMKSVEGKTKALTHSATMQEGTLMTYSTGVKVWDIIGRSVVARQEGAPPTGFSLGVIARSAGVRENPKKICLCDSPGF